MKDEAKSLSSKQWMTLGSQKIRHDPPIAKKMIGYGLKTWPDCDIGWYNMGIAMHMNKKISAAIKCYKLALKYARTEELETNAKNNLAQDLLAIGQWNEGFSLYENRFKRKTTKYKQYIDLFGEPWKGLNDPRPCREILIVSEQGFGDTLQFIRLIKILQQKGIRTSFFGQEELRPLLQKGTELGPFLSMLSSKNGTRWCTLLSIPYLINLKPETIQSIGTYIRPDPNNVEKWRKILRRSPKKKLVAMHWQGNPKFEKSTYSQGRSMPFEVMQQLGDLQNIEYLFLQKGDAASQINEINSLPMVAGQDVFSKSMNFEDTAAALACCDLLISSDSCVVHLAGAMGIPVWIALSYVPEWRWGLSGTQSLWYETAYLFRQKKAGDWEEVIREIREKLQIIFPGEPISA